MATLETRLARLEAKEAADACLVRYLDLCDVPGPLADLDQIGALFTEDAVWEGIGPEYEGKFGRAEGRAAVQDLVGGYLPPVDHFIRNAHLATSGQVRVEGDEATGQWLMQQLSLHRDGGAELLCARISVDFALARVRHQPPTALIRHFRTQRLFAAPLDTAALGHLLS
ncbi:SnoaL-like domain-containing protein [Raineyella antarctica]|uniref:SnoaL-like domain-containing protein n=1 Tax=Raineyella antarctica TaxID=1577474 RepID=A0A1G6GIU8_9ACTN|nr:nuclear transport factor 2 family protein [Raineyella antarctica]SDB81942.1 SnoaL-like domain-containing protein [Raineyella antarctica]